MLERLPQDVIANLWFAPQQIKLTQFDSFIQRGMNEALQKK
jgi:hypothetical protein